jgi:ribosomal protein S10
MYSEILTFDVADLSDKQSSKKSVFRSQPFDIILESVDLAQVNTTAVRLKGLLASLGIVSKGPIAKKKGVRHFKLKAIDACDPDKSLDNVLVHTRTFKVSQITKKQSLKLIQFPSSSCVNIRLYILEQDNQS